MQLVTPTLLATSPIAKVESIHTGANTKHSELCEKQTYLHSQKSGNGRTCVPHVAAISFVITTTLATALITVPEACKYSRNREV